MGSPKIKFQESGGGWKNPLMGRVFDSDQDLPDEVTIEFDALVGRCDFSRSGELDGRPAADAPTFELKIEADDKIIRIIGDTQRADTHLKALVNFIRKHSRNEMLE